MKIHPPLLAGALVLVTLALHFMLPEERTVGWEQVIGLLLVAAGAGLSSFAAAIFQARETARKPWGEPPKFVEQPPFTWTRNPMYLGLAATLLGLALVYGSIAKLLARAVSS